MKSNIRQKSPKAFTYEGGPAMTRQPELVELERAVSACLLYENTYYEKGSDIADRIRKLCVSVDPDAIAALAVRARNDLRLRHVPLFLARQLARLRYKRLADLMEVILQRPDEITEFLALYWQDNDQKRTLPAQVKKGVARAFRYFNEYQLAKWNRDGKVKLRDALFLSHAKPMNGEQASLWERLASGTLATPDTWEVSLSAGADKKATWERLLSEKKLGQMALLMNLRNMVSAGVQRELVQAALRSAKGKALPFRFVSAYQAAPSFAQDLSDAMLESIDREALHFPGQTVVIVDVSGSMDSALSARSTMLRWVVAASIAVLAREVCQWARIFTFSNDVAEVPSIRGIPLVDAIGASQAHSGTYLGRAVQEVTKRCPDANRIIVVTDEQAHDRLTPSMIPGYIINVASYQPALPTCDNGWTRVNGFSERVLDWIQFDLAG